MKAYYIHLLSNLSNNTITQYFYKFFTKGQARTAKVKKNIAVSFVFKAINIISGILIVPLAIDYLDATRYGIWLTLSSVVMWFGFFDVGLGHGLRNKFAEALARGDQKLAAKYVSTAYAVLGCISISFFIVFFIVNNFLNWAVLLNTRDVPGAELSSLALLVFGFFALRFVLQLINSVLFADQKPALKDIIETTGKVINLVIIYILIHTTKDSLLYLGISYSAAPVLVLVLSSTFLYTSTYRSYAPRIKYVDFSLLKDIVGLGWKFFIIQISAVVLYTTDNMIITQLFSPKEVTPYQIAHRYFGLVLMFFMVIVTPFWSAITEAYIKKEYTWIKKSINKLVQIWTFVVIVIILMLTISQWVYKLWIGDKVYIPFFLSAAWAFFILIQTLNTIFVHFINGTGKIKLQMILAIIMAVVNIPLSIFLARFVGLGVVGVIGATITTQIIALYFVILQYNKLIANRAHGIWNL